MKLVVGLGNPGERYAQTRHNIGFLVLDEIIRKYVASPQVNKKLGAILYSLDKERLLLKPQTFMNRSGGPVVNIIRFYKIKPENLLVIHDDVDLKFGEIKQQFARGSAGHKGVDSIIESLGTEEFNRVRVGVGRPDPAVDGGMETDAWVLQKFSKEEETKLEEIIFKAFKLVSDWLKN
jgi:PTH1 family peptidyl-tRNA hydrolase